MWWRVLTESPKISIDDDPGIRSQIESLTGELSQQQLAKWALITQKRAVCRWHQKHDRQLRLAIDANELWQVNLASVTKCAKPVPKLAMGANSTSSIGAAALECISWAIASAYVDENALRAADQAIKLVNLTQWPSSCHGRTPVAVPAIGRIGSKHQFGVTPYAIMPTELKLGGD